MQTGLEKMVASMLGVTPEAMNAMVENAVGLLNTLDTRLKRIENALGIPPIENETDGD